MRFSSTLKITRSRSAVLLAPRSLQASAPNSAAASSTEPVSFRHLFATASPLGPKPHSFLIRLATSPKFFTFVSRQEAQGAALMAGKSVNKVILIGNLGKDP